MAIEREGTEAVPLCTGLLKVIFYKDFGFVCIVAIAPPCEAEGDTFWGHHYAILGGTITTEDDRTCNHITRVG